MKINDAKIQKININKSSNIHSTAIVQDGAQIVGSCTIGKNSFVSAGSVIDNSVIGEGVKIKCSYVENAIIKNNVTIGPFAHIRPNSVVCEGVKIGNFVEIKNSNIGKNTKVSHLAYVGDADVGKDCNIGCGAIFVNYDGKAKHRTVVEDECFIGSNCNIIAPVKISKQTYICAGTTLTKDTNAFDFVIGRTKETIKNNYSQKYFKGGK